MGTTTALPVQPALGSPCGECGRAVLVRFTTEQRQVTLDAEAELGGLYRLDRYNRAQRRSLVLLYMEERADNRQLGYNPHECRPRDWWDRD